MVDYNDIIVGNLYAITTDTSTEVGWLTDRSEVIYMRTGDQLFLIDNDLDMGSKCVSVLCQHGKKEIFRGLFLTIVKEN